MALSTINFNTPLKKVFATLVLSLLAWVGNYCNLSLLFGLDFIFGSIAVMLAVMLVGPVAAVVVALVGGSYTWLLWGVPYPFLIFTLEALVVAWVFQRQANRQEVMPSLITINLGYWILLGIPLVLLIYRSLLDFGWESSLMIALKQSINGVFNALVASGLVLIAHWNSRAFPSISFGRLLFHLLLTMTLLTASIPILYSTFFKQDELEKGIHQQLSQQARLLVDHWGEPLKPLLFVDQVAVALVSSDESIQSLAGETLRWQDPGLLKATSSDLEVWLPPGSMSSIRRWTLGRYIYQLDLTHEGIDGHLHLEVPTQEVVAKLEQKRVELLYLLAGLILFSFFISRVLTRWLTRPLAQLNQAGLLLADQLADKQNVQLTSTTPVREFVTLTQTLQSMSDHLASSFKKLSQQQEELERRVQKRTWELSEEKKHFESFFTVNLDLLSIATLDGQFVRTNKAWASTLGYTLEELEGQHFLDFVHPEDMEATVHSLGQLGQQEQVLNFINRYRCKDGSYRFLEWSAQPEGELIYAAARDITAHRDLEVTLHKRQVFLETVLNALPNPVFVKNWKGEYLLVNQATLALLGQTEEAVMGQTDHAFLPDEEAKAMVKIDQQVMRTGEPYFCAEEFMTDSQGQGHYFQTSKLPLQQEGALIHRRVVGIAINITQQKQDAAALEAAKKVAEQASEAKSRFLANMSHEIRTPMNGILSMARLLVEDDNGSAKSRHHARQLLQSGEGLLALLNDLLDFSSMEAGAVKIDATLLRPEILLQEVQALYYATAQEKDLALTWKWQGDSDVSYLGDAQRIRQLLSNLTSNALKFTSQGKIEMSAWPLTEQKNALTGLGLAVTDTGIGIPQEKMDRLFKPFSQLDDSTSRQYGGTGLGLSIVRSLVELMDGQCGVESQPGEGSRFWVTLPMPQGESKATSGPARFHASYAAPEELPVRQWSDEDQEALRAAVSQLQNALDQQSFSALDSFYRLQTLVQGSDLEVSLKSLEKAIQAFRFETALKKLVEWQKKLNIM